MQLIDVGVVLTRRKHENKTSSEGPTCHSAKFCISENFPGEQVGQCLSRKHGPAHSTPAGHSAEQRLTSISNACTTPRCSTGTVELPTRQPTRLCSPHILTYIISNLPNTLNDSLGFNPESKLLSLWRSFRIWHTKLTFCNCFMLCMKNAWLWYLNLYSSIIETLHLVLRSADEA
jgi:hypothetical protein